MTAVSERGPGAARSEGVSVQDILHREAERQPVPQVLLEESYTYLGSEDLPVGRYISPEFARLEEERLWTRVWQMACREEDIPNVGDHIVYDIVRHSIIVVRTAPDEIKAFHNACLHRGTALRDIDGNVPFFRCPFHGWTWKLDGSLKSIPARWDFKHAKPENFGLPEARVGTWSGFVFVNMDPDCGPLEDHLEVLPEHFANWDLGKRLKAAHVAKIVPANWKVAMEAFMEAYHVKATHPQLSWYNGDENSQYDIYGENVSRFNSLLGTPTPALGDIGEDVVAEAFARDFRIGDGSAVSVPEGSTAREVIAGVMRRMLEAGTGVPMDSVSTTEAIDSIEYYLFPNFLPWPGLGVPIVYRFRPNGTDVDSSIMEIMLLAPLPEGIERPPAAKIHWLETEDFRDAPELGVLGLALNQDYPNLRRLQKGLHATKKPGVTLGDYQEVRIRHYHRTLMRYLEQE